MKWNNKNAWLMLLLSGVGAILLLLFFFNKVKEKNFDDLALGDKTTTAFEKLDGQQINYLDFNVDENATQPLFHDEKDFILSFGNSQSHSINSYQPGKNHLFIYYVAKQFPKYNVLNMSAPNANFQEMFLGLINAERVFDPKIKKVFISCIFDDTREDGIRPKMAPLINNNVSTLSKYASGKKIIARMDKNVATGKNQSNILLKYKVEDTLNDFAEAHSDTYAKRGSIHNQLYSYVYNFRNWIFSIKPTSKRKKIEMLYPENLLALKDIAEFCKSHEIELFFYIAPLRQDIEMPYFKSEYDTFKKEISEIHTTYNLEKIVPGKYWGETNGDWVDFMHFKGEGHILLAKELEKILRKEGVE